LTYGQGKNVVLNERAGEVNFQKRQRSLLTQGVKGIGQALEETIKRYHDTPAINQGLKNIVQHNADRGLISPQRKENILKLPRFQNMRTPSRGPG